MGIRGRVWRTKPKRTDEASNWLDLGVQRVDVSVPPHEPADSHGRRGASADRGHAGPKVLGAPMVADMFRRAGPTASPGEDAPVRDPARASTVSHRVAFDLFILVELALVVALGVVTKVIWVDGYLDSPEPLTKYLPAFVVVAPLLFIIFRDQGLYEAEANNAPPLRVGKIPFSILLAFLLLIAAGFLVRIANDYSRGWMIVWFAASCFGVLALRTGAYALFRRMSKAGAFVQRVAVVGDEAAAQAFVAQLAKSNPGVQLVFTLQPQATLQAENDLKRLISLGLSDGVDRIFILQNSISCTDVADRQIAESQPDNTDTGQRLNLSMLLEALSALPVSISLITQPLAPGLPIHGITRHGDRAFVDLQRRPITDHGVWLKAAEDYSLGALAMVLFAPVFFIVALAIKLETPGPVFFKQRRHGYNHKIITVWKFRTMRVLEDGPVIKQATRNDDRVTRVGAFLRKTSLDELPQLINVLRGEMSLVGPRPHALAHNEMYAAMLRRYANRHRVKPGITGWAQIHGFRGPTDDPELMRRRVELDLEYIERWSIWLDLRILIATPIYGFVGRNAF